MSLCKVKMGRLKYDSVTRKVTPLSAKGELTVAWVEDQKHLHWSSEDKSADELDIIVFAGDARFDVYKNNIFILWFQTYEDKYFFWLQDSVSPSDVQKKVQEALNVEEPQPSQSSGMQIQSEHKAEDKPKPAEAQKPAPSANKVQAMQGLQGMIQRIMKKNQEEKQRREELSLTKLFSGEFLRFIQENPTQELIKHLPEGQQNKESLRENIYSPQLQQALDNLEEALYSESASSLFYEMNLDLKFLEQNYGTEALLKALVKWAKDGQKK